MMVLFNDYDEYERRTCPLRRVDSVGGGQDSRSRHTSITDYVFRNVTIGRRSEHGRRRPVLHGTDDPLGRHDRK
ncbi:unnamed protein product [Sphagnum balticum]